MEDPPSCSMDGLTLINGSLNGFLGRSGCVVSWCYCAGLDTSVRCSMVFGGLYLVFDTLWSSGGFGMGSLQFWVTIFFESSCLNSWSFWNQFIQICGTLDPCLQSIQNNLGNVTRNAQRLKWPGKKRSRKVSKTPAFLSLFLFQKQTEPTTTLAPRFNPGQSSLPESSWAVYQGR